MSKKFRPTRSECMLIRQFAEQAAKQNRVKLEIGARHNMADHRIPQDINVALVSETYAKGEGWGDTDLADHRPWSEFTSGVLLTDDGAGLFDFWVYNRIPFDGDLETNVQAIFEKRRLVRIEEQGTVLWAADPVDVR